MLGCMTMIVNSIAEGEKTRGNIEVLHVVGKQGVEFIVQKSMG